MNEQTDKIKICDIIADCFTKEENFTWNGRLVPKLANALIAAGIGDVSEYKHRAQVAEKALKHAVNVYIAHTETSSKKKWWYKYFLREAEKELAEEGKDD